MTIAYRTGPIVVVQALDGRYNYGPAHVAVALASEEFGVYPTIEAAKIGARAARRSWARAVIAVSARAT